MKTTLTTGFHFGGSERFLYGWFHRSTRLHQRRAAVLLCNPLGEEAARAHRLYRVLATQLERAGFPALRFDLGGTGDSAGASEDATVEGWLDDIATAARHNARDIPDSRLVVVGLRLGGTLAALASARRELRVRHLVLWDPVVDGKAYLRDLATAHRAFMLDELGRENYRDTLVVDAEGFPTEALGTPLLPPLLQGLGSIDLTREHPRADHVTVVSTSSSAEAQAFREAVAAKRGVQWVPVAGSPAWNSDAALNAATVPMDVLQTILSRIEEVSP